MPDALTVIVPRPADPAAFLARWQPALEELKRDYEILFAGAVGNDTERIRFLTSAETGLGHELRVALPVARHPLVFVVGDDPRYVPNDLKPLLEKFETPGDVYGVQRLPDAASGYRAGVPAPALAGFFGRAYRVACRVVFGLPLDASPGWLGSANHVRIRLAAAILGQPLADPNSLFKLFRKSVFDKFPIQSPGGFALPEIFAKLTFTGSVLVEEPLSPMATPVPRAEWGGWFGVLTNSQFTPQKPDVRKTAAPVAP
jgi:hypothetical protein